MKISMIAFLILLGVINFSAIKIINNPNYGSFRTLKYIIKYDIVGMSFHKKELLFPEGTINLGDITKQDIMQDIYKYYSGAYDDVVVYSSIPKLRSLQRDITIEEGVDVYINNIPWYIAHRLFVLYRYLVWKGNKHNYSVYFEAEESTDLSYAFITEKAIQYSKNKTIWNIFGEKLRNKIHSITSYIHLQTGLAYSLMFIITFIVLLLYSKQLAIVDRDKYLIFAIIISGILNFIIVILGSGSIQFRYIIWFSLSSWMGFIYLLAILSTKGKTQFLLKD